jgi:PucR family transcriptional regulator, purine catabolism regulatory protein
MRSALSVRDLLATETLRHAEVAGGAAGLDARVTGIRLITEGHDWRDFDPGTGVVFETGPGQGVTTYRQHLVELIARRMHARGGRVLIVTGGQTGQLAASTVRLADRLGIPVAIALGVPGPELAADLLALVHTPGIAIAQAVAAAARGLRSAAGALDRTLPALESMLHARCAAILPDGTVAAGQPPVVAHTLLPRHPVTVAERTGDVAFAVSPVPGANSPAALWLVAESDRGGLAWADTAAILLDMAAGYVAGRNAADELAAERDARYLSGLLTELLQAGDPVPTHIAERTAKAGWVLDGWHTALYVTGLGVATARPPALPPAARARLSGALAEVIPARPFVEHGDAWVTWTTSAHEPATAEHEALLGGLRQVMARYHLTPGVPPIVLGVGNPASGAGGLATSMTQARQAATVAAASGRTGTVQPAEGLSMLRLLAGWYGSAIFADHATQLLQPLLVAEGGEQLLETLEAYLDSGRSPTETAARLGLHRNTVAQRIRRAEQELSVSLDDPDQRLAVHLASRMLRINSPEPYLRFNSSYSWVNSQLLPKYRDISRVICKTWRAFRDTRLEPGKRMTAARAAI